MLEKSKIFSTMMFEPFTKLNHIIDNYNINPVLVNKNDLRQLGKNLEGYTRHQNTYQRVLNTIPKPVVLSAY